LQQIICTIKKRRAPTRCDNIDFRPIIKRTSNILPLSVFTADKDYDSDDVCCVAILMMFSTEPMKYILLLKGSTHRQQANAGSLSTIESAEATAEDPMAVFMYALRGP
jgi:hypothetical protein